jgi:hypothetical protein
MKASLLLAALALAACDGDPNGVQLGFTPGAVTGQARAIAVRGLVSGPGGQVIVGASVRVAAVPADVNGICLGTSTAGTATSSATGEYRVQLSVPETVLSVCVTATVTPPTGSTLRATTVDLGRLATSTITTGVPVPEVQGNIQLTP